MPLEIGDNCRTAEPVTITAATPDGEGFTVAAGGRLTATYTVGAFTGCSPLVGDLVTGSDHTVELRISNPRNVG